MSQPRHNNGQGFRHLPGSLLSWKGGTVSQILIDCPDELIETAGQTKAELQKLAQEAFLVRLYHLGQISSGRAAEILHISRRAFLDLLGQCGISLFDEEVDLGAEASNGR